MAFTVEKRTVNRTGIASLGWYFGYGYVQEKITVKKDVWCVINSDGIVCECRSKSTAFTIAAVMNGEGK